MMSSIDLSQIPKTIRNDLTMTFYRDLEQMMSTPGGREYIETRTAERLARQTDKQTD